jgi:hypothetical protein
MINLLDKLKYINLKIVNQYKSLILINIKI